PPAVPVDTVERERRDPGQGSGELPVVADRPYATASTVVGVAAGGRQAPVGSDPRIVCDGTAARRPGAGGGFPRHPAAAHGRRSPSSPPGRHRWHRAALRTPQRWATRPPVRAPRGISPHPIIR